jgi:hypothetical protein
MIKTQKRPMRCATSLLLATCLALAATIAARAADAAGCRVATGDFCVCCPPSDCRKEASFCPGGAGGLLVLEAKHPECAVNPYDAARCRSGGVIASEQTSALGVYVQGQRARIDLAQEQLDALVAQLEALRR